VTEDKSVGIYKVLMSWLLKASPFPSESLDNLAEIMHVTKILKKSKLDRYYKMRFLPAGGMASLDRVLFDAKYLATLLPEEVLAIGAHEFTHLNQRHGRKRFWRLVVPAIMIGTVIGFLVFFNFALINSVHFLNNWGKVESSLFAAVFVGLFALTAGTYVNAKWLRQQETECDLSTIKFSNDEAMISSLIKFNKLHPKQKTRLDRLIPMTYPTLEQRINDIRTATENKKNQGS